VDDELIWWCALATRAACARMTAQHMKALQDSVGQARCLPARFAWDRKATIHAQIINLLADAAGAAQPADEVRAKRRQGAARATPRPVPAVILNNAVGAVYDLMITVGPAADGIILSSRRRLLDLIRAGDAEGAAAEMEQHLRRLHFMWKLSRNTEPGGIAV
jgi:DNA-binding FadR family transcriptional regulator